MKNVSTICYWEGAIGCYHRLMPPLTCDWNELRSFCVMNVMVKPERTRCPSSRKNGTDVSMLFSLFLLGCFGWFVGSSLVPYISSMGGHSSSRNSAIDRLMVEELLMLICFAFVFVSCYCTSADCLFVEAGNSTDRYMLYT